MQRRCDLTAHVVALAYMQMGGWNNRSDARLVSPTHTVLLLLSTMVVHGQTLSAQPIAQNHASPCGLRP